jgi:anti-sigma factor RsiW
MSEHIDRFTLDAYVEQVLPVAERRVVEAHITTCPTCQVRLAAAKQMPALLYQLPREKPAPDLAARINAVVVAQHIPATAHWMQMSVAAVFALGLVLFALAVPQWSAWVQAMTIAQLPTEQTVLIWLGSLLSDPVSSFDSLLSLAGQWLVDPVGEMNVLLTLAATLLAVASVAGLAQLLSGERPLATTVEGQA